MLISSCINHYSRSMARKLSARVLQGPDLTYTIKETMGKFFFDKAEKYSDRICQIDANTDKSETFGSVKIRSVRVAMALQKRGITSEDVIEFCAANSLDITIPQIAAFFLGAKVVHLDPVLGVINTRYLLSTLQTSLIFVDESVVPLIELSLVGAKYNPEIIVFGQSTDHQTFAEYVKPQQDEDKFRPAEVDPNDVIFIIFSSGSTGMPKPICHTHVSFLSNTRQFCQRVRTESIYHVSSFYSFATMSVMTYLFQVGKFRVFSSFTVENFFRTLDKYKPTCTCATPPLTYMLTSYENAKKYDTSSLRRLVISGAPLASAQVKRVLDLFKNTSVHLLYGMCEVCVVLFDMRHEQEDHDARPSFSGQLYPGIELKVVDLKTEKPLGPNEKGEIRVKSLSVMKRYYDVDPSRCFDNEGFFKTGDMGYYDENDRVHVVDRIGEMIKYKNDHIAPSILEATLREHPAVKDAGVFGIPDEETVEVPAACVVLKEGQNVSKEEILQFLDKYVSNNEKLRGGVKFVKELPKTSTMKLDRELMKDTWVANK